MKMKSIIKCGLLLLGLGTATVSCEDMFTAENTLVTTELAPKDTLYQVMGIIKRMQKLADRTVLLGEVRADLVDVDPLHASADIQELAKNDVSATNAYNQPSDYYAVINSCNIYLTYVDSLRKAQGTLGYFENEILAVKCYRAWCYLELLKIYGEVPYLRTPVLNSDDAEAIVASGKKEGWIKIVSDMINDLKDFSAEKNNELRQGYANQSFNSVPLRNVAIPVRIMLAELYLWRASYTDSKDDYINAIRMYHDYFTFPNEEVGTGTNTQQWATLNARRPEGSYASTFESENNYAGLLPMETSGYHGTVSELRRVFCSLDSNNYYPAVMASQRAKSISNSQDYCQLILAPGSKPDIMMREHDANLYSSYPTMEGDTRLYAITDGPTNVGSNHEKSKENSAYNNVYYLNRKYGNTTDGTDYLKFVPFFRNSILYLHFAEALNRGGFPQTAFAILKYGLSYYTLTDPTIISQNEFDRLCEITSYGFTAHEPHYTSDKEMSSKTRGSAVIWNSNKFSAYYIFSPNEINTYPQKPKWEDGNLIQIGIHSFGSGDSEYNDKYVIDDEETLAALAKIDEERPVFHAPEPGDYTNVILVDPDDKDTKVKEGTYVIVDFVTEDGETLQGQELTEEEWNTYIDEYENAYLTYYKAYNEWVDTREAYQSSDELLAKRQARVAQLILDEEALEGVFEGLRFYDIMRYQMQEMGGAAIGNTITMPAYIEEKYGTTTKMVGKPWFLTLPKR